MKKNLSTLLFIIALAGLVIAAEQALNYNATIKNGASDSQLTVNTANTYSKIILRTASGAATLYKLEGQEMLYFDTAGVYPAMYSNYIYERTPAAGVTIDGVLCKDSVVTASLTGNAATATKLETARLFTITDNDATNSQAAASSFDGSAAYTVKLPATIKATITGDCSGAAGSVAAANITGLGTGVATWLATPSSANLASALTGETGTGAAVFGTSPDFTTSITFGAGDVTLANSAPNYLFLSGGNLVLDGVDMIVTNSESIDFEMVDGSNKGGVRMTTGNWFEFGCSDIQNNYPSAVGHVFYSVVKPNANNSIDIGTSTALWKTVYTAQILGSSVGLGLYNDAGGSGGTGMIFIADNGRIGINNSVPAYALDAVPDGNAYYKNETHWYSSSDVSLKENIKPITGALEKVCALRGVTYEWKDKAKRGNKRHSGFIAQEVEAAIPEWVITEESGLKGLQINDTALFAEAIKQLKSENDALRARVEKLEKK